METSQKIVVAALVGLGGYVAYRYVYLPARVRAILAAQAAAAGMSYDAYVARIGAVACQGLAAYYGAPPQATGGVCGIVGQGVASAPSWLTSIGNSAASSTQAAGLALGVALPAIGQGAGGLVSGVAHGVGGGMKAITDASVYGIRQTGSLVESGAEGAGSLFKKASVGASLLPVDVAKGVVGGVKSVANALFSW